MSIWNNFIQKFSLEKSKIEHVLAGKLSSTPCSGPALEELTLAILKLALFYQYCPLA